MHSQKVDFALSVSKTLFTSLSTLDLMDLSYNRSYFFDTGIRFECQRCGVDHFPSGFKIYVPKQSGKRFPENVRVSGVDNFLLRSKY